MIVQNYSSRRRIVRVEVVLHLNWDNSKSYKQKQNCLTFYQWEQYHTCREVRRGNYYFSGNKNGLEILFQWYPKLEIRAFTKGVNSLLVIANFPVNSCRLGCDIGVMMPSKPGYVYNHRVWEKWYFFKCGKPRATAFCVKYEGTIAYCIYTLIFNIHFERRTNFLFPV